MAEHSGCVGIDGRTKRVYADWREARAAAKRLKADPRHKKERGRLAPYRCPDCSQLHIGHTRQPGRPRRPDATD